MNQTSCCIPFCTVWALFHEDCSSGFEMAMFFSRLITVLKENKSQNSYHFVIIWYLTRYGFGLLTHKMISTWLESCLFVLSYVFMSGKYYQCREILKNIFSLCYYISTPQQYFVLRQIESSKTQNVQNKNVTNCNNNPLV